MEGTITRYAQAKWFVSYETFVARIANKEIPGTFMNLMNAVANLSSLWHKPIIMSLVEVVSYYILFTSGLIYNIMFTVLTKEWLNEKQNKDEEWKFIEEIQ